MSVVIMKLVVYKNILDIIHAKPRRDSLLDVISLYPEYSRKTLGSIFSQDYQRKIKKSFFRHSTEEKMDEYYFRYCEESQQKRHSHVILHMATKADFSPALLARIILERHLLYSKYNGQPALKSEVSQLMKDTTLIDDPLLAMEIDICVASDDVYGPIVDTIKHSLGHEYEFLLKKKLDDAGLAYQDEDQLRAKGYDKTPDFILQVPIAVDGRVVNWIESKASFGDQESHSVYLKDQFWSYWNRFGSGIVIYWFGFIDELDVNREKGISLMDHFPADFITMT